MLCALHKYALWTVDNHYTPNVSRFERNLREKRLSNFQKFQT